jgi:aldose 1-epimerase
MTNGGKHQREKNKHMNMDRRTFALAAAAALASCAKKTAEEKGSTQVNQRLTRKDFGKTTDGSPIELFTLRNGNGMEVAISTYGAVVQSLKLPDKSGTPVDIVLGYDDLAGYENDKSYFGATIGRYGNRIGHARFTLDGVEYKLPANDGPNCLHGGTKGFNKRVWTPKGATAANPPVMLEYVSKDGEEGFPGNLTATVTFTLSDNNELRIDYHAVTDKPTVVNLTNHSYFNLSGEGNGDILSHEVMIDGDRITPVDATLIPTGQYMKVEGTPFDFRSAHAIGERINANNQQIKFGKGYDHNWVLNHTGAGPTLAARVHDPKSNRSMEVLTTEPGLQFYTGNFLDGSVKGKRGKAYQHRSAFCMETQHFPDSPNKKDFPSTTLRPGQEYKSTTIYRFMTA